MIDAELMAALGRLTVPVVGGIEVSGSGDLPTSYIQHVSHCGPGEAWPKNAKGKPLHPLAQIYLPELPWITESLRDLTLITVFLDTHCEYDEIDIHNGNGWLLRAYTSDDPLIPMQTPKFRGKRTRPPAPKRLIWGDPITDLPEDADRVPDAWRDRWREYFLSRSEHRQCSQAIKVGGYPPQIQWPPHFCEFRPNEDDIATYGTSICDTEIPNPAAPEFVFQVASMHELEYYYMDMGIHYFARGTGDYRDKWFRDETSY